MLCLSYTHITRTHKHNCCQACFGHSKYMHGQAILPNSKTPPPLMLLTYGCSTGQQPTYVDSSTPSTYQHYDGTEGPVEAGCPTISHACRYCISSKFTNDDKASERALSHPHLRLHASTRGQIRTTSLGRYLSLRGYRGKGVDEV